ncbi:P-loop containing nucleoside triphosphate hydrolase protein [Papiliotrema laurentii]|uniref:Kinesin-like protein n=1 Tax=Papiliotrema laurentii TaxID=5418 RepID=A0AAD9FTM5_PAPLA|nr:P-loop containing nucleoside triphosphate hydrolase protein [Papiliotrema laurentii]
MQCQHSEGRATPSAKLSSRPRIAVKAPVTPSSTRSPPLTTSQFDNTPHVSSLLTPREGGVKLRIKSSTTPEAKSRLAIRKPPAGVPPVPPILSTPSYRASAHSAPRHAPDTQVPSGSTLDTSDAWLGGQSSGDAYETVQADSQGQKLEASEAVLVTVRVRPPNAVEESRDSSTVWDTPSWDHHLIKLGKGREGIKDDREWIFDRILPPESDNARAYATSAQAHVHSAMEGYNAVIFAYGQTASGKTHTLTGSRAEPGIIPLSISDLFAQIRGTPDREFLLRASYLELYNETILDLLSPEIGKELTLSEGKKKGEVVINGLTECAVRTEEEVRRLLQTGEDRRKVGGTDWNQRSSRSHCVFRIVIESRASRLNAADDVGRTPGGRLKSAGEKMTRISTLSIIDLAGSEKHTSSKERNAEGKHINQSLLTLKMVISKLADLASKRNVTHVPYRDSKLTRLLQPSLSGDALISVICTVSPSALNLAESLSTLSFAQGLKRVTLKAQRKEVVDPQALIQQYQNEIAELRALLREKEVGGVQDFGVSTSRSERTKNEAMEKRLNELKSLILTSVNVNSSTGADRPGEARPLSPTKLKYPRLDFDKSTTDLQEDLHAAQLQIAKQADEITRLKSELDARPVNPDARIVQLQDEVAGLKMIADDYERNLLEPSRKVREDVEREFQGIVQKLETQLESKRIWANRLDENVRMVTAENKDLKARCQEAEAKVFQIMEWINTALSPEESSSPTRPSHDLPTLVVSQEQHDDFSPARAMNKQSTITLNASKMTRAQLSQMDLASFNSKFGTLSLSGKGRLRALGGGTGMRMLREESGFNLAEVAGEDEETY